MFNDQLYTKEFIEGLASGIRCCVNEIIRNHTPFSVFVEEYDYRKYIAKYKSEIIKFIPVNYIGFMHTHKDSYFHCIGEDQSVLDSIMRDGKLLVDKSDDYNAIGKAVYTYPVESGMLFYKHETDKILLFDANQEHVHITQTDDSPTCIGDCCFLSDVEIIDPKIISVEEAKQISRERFDWNKAQKDYYGINIKTNYKNFKSILNYCNDNIYCP